MAAHFNLRTFSAPTPVMVKVGFDTKPLPEAGLPALAGATNRIVKSERRRRNKAARAARKRNRRAA